MDRQEQILNLVKIARISVSYAEDLYDSFFPKPVVPQYVADWYWANRDGLEFNLIDWINKLQLDIDSEEFTEFDEWLTNTDNNPIQTLVDMHRLGYEVEEEKRYTVRIKGVDGYATHLNENLDNHEWFFASDDEIKGYRIKHTRKELESNGFGWVFSCEGVEVKEVE